MCSPIFKYLKIKIYLYSLFFKLFLKKSGGGGGGGGSDDGGGGRGGGGGGDGGGTGVWKNLDL